MNRSIYSDQALEDMAAVRSVLVACDAKDITDDEGVAEQIVLALYRRGLMTVFLWRM